MAAAAVAPGVALLWAATLLATAGAAAPAATQILPATEQAAGDHGSSCEAAACAEDRAETAVWPQPVARVEWRERRAFDKDAAVREVQYPAESSGGLQSDDQAMLWRIYGESDSVFEMGVGESTKIAVFTGWVTLACITKLPFTPCFAGLPHLITAQHVDCELG